MIEVRRVFEAPRALVWAAWIDPVHSGLVGPARMAITRDAHPRRPAGRRLHHVSVHEDTGERMTIDGVFDEVVEGERLSFTHAAARSVATFSRARRPTHRARRPHRPAHVRCPPAQGDRGVCSAFDRLADHLQHNLEKEYA